MTSHEPTPDFALIRDVAGSDRVTVATVDVDHLEDAVARAYDEGLLVCVAGDLFRVDAWIDATLGGLTMRLFKHAFAKGQLRTVFDWCRYDLLPLILESASASKPMTLRRRKIATGLRTSEVDYTDLLDQTSELWRCTSQGITCDARQAITRFPYRDKPVDGVEIQRAVQSIVAVVNVAQLAGVRPIAIAISATRMLRQLESCASEAA